MSQQQQQQGPFQYQTQAGPPYQHATPSTLPSFLSQRQTHNRRPSDLSDVATSELHTTGVNHPELLQRKHEQLAGRFATDEALRNRMIANCAAETPHLLPQLQQYMDATGIKYEAPPAPLTIPVTAQNNPSLRQLEAERVQEILDDQKRLDYATQRYREAGEAFHFWETELFKINGRMKTRERLAEVETLSKTEEK